MAIKTKDTYYRIIFINESLSGNLDLMVRGFDSEEAFKGAKLNPEDGVSYIRYEKEFSYPLSIYEQDRPLRDQVYKWLASGHIEGDIIEDIIV